jgi:hypothetical protein
VEGSEDFDTYTVGWSGIVGKPPRFLDKLEMTTLVGSHVPVGPLGSGHKTRNDRDVVPYEPLSRYHRITPLFQNLS